MLNQQHPVLNSTDSYIELLLKRVLRAENFGISRGNIEFNPMTTSYGKVRDRFRLSIPYARQNLTWIVSFDTQHPEIGPDFVFHDENFLADINANSFAEQVPSLANWNPYDVDSLLNVLIELLECYKEYQIQLISKHNRLQVEYSTLVETAKAKSEEVEIILLPIGLKPTEARFLISLTIDVCQLPGHDSQLTTDTAMLIVTFYESDWNRIVPQLILSEFLQEAFGGQGSLQIPPFPANKCLMDYVPEVNKCIMNKIKSVIQFYNMKSMFMANILSNKYGGVLEWDSKQHTYITLLMQQSDFCFIMNCKLVQGFPFIKPIIELQSIYHEMEDRTLYTETLSNYPYSHKWPPFEMVQSLFKHIEKSAAQNFQHNCMKHNQM